MTKPLRLLVLIIACTALSAVAAIPAGYYSSLNGKKDAELKLAAHNLIKNFTLISSYSDLPRYFRVTDVYPDGERWWDMYSDQTFYIRSFSGLNREHSFPKSWWGGSTDVSAYVDLNHLYPSEQRANSAKSNYPLGMVDRNQTIKFQNGVSTVGYPVRGQGGGAGSVYEPADEYKGDFARTYFYMVTAYQNLTWRYTYMVGQNAYPTLNAWSVELLMQWHRQDPVSQKEIDRNEAVYNFQSNRNPFIDMPELAEYLWGTRKGEAFTPGNVEVPPAGDPQLIAPAPNMELQFGQVALGESVTARLYVRGSDLINPIELLLYTGNSKMFSMGTDAIAANLANSEEGYWLNVTYTPTELGSHKSRILVSGDFEGSRGVALTGECLPVPTLSACTATEPTDIQADRYTANWTAPANEVIDYFIVTRTRYYNGSAESMPAIAEEELPAENTSLEILGFNESDYETYSVQSVRLGVRSPQSNIVFVNHSGVSGVTVEQPLMVQSFEGFVRIICSAPQTGCRVFDTLGRLVAAPGTVEQNSDIYLPTGIYFITTDAHATPVKAVVR